MIILTPAETAAFRAAYMHSLTMALINRDVMHWLSATDEEREEVRHTLSLAGIRRPSEKSMVAPKPLGKKPVVVETKGSRRRAKAESA